MVLFNYATKEITAKIVYYGPGLCGKTTNLQFVYDSLPSNNKSKMLSLATKTDRTLFFDFLPLDLGKIRGMRTKLQLYTVPGQVYYNSTRQLVLKGADGVVFVADSQDFALDANLESLQNLEDNLKRQGVRIREMPIVIQYNKRDLPNAQPVANLDAAMNKLRAPSFESVATTGIGVEETLKGITQLVLAHLIRKYNLAGSEPLEKDIQILNVPTEAAAPESLWEEAEEGTGACNRRAHSAFSRERRRVRARRRPRRHDPARADRAARAAEAAAAGGSRARSVRRRDRLLQHTGDAPSVPAGTFRGPADVDRDSAACRHPRLAADAGQRAPGAVESGRRGIAASDAHRAPVDRRPGQGSQHPDQPLTRRAAQPPAPAAEDHAGCESPDVDRRWQIADRRELGGNARPFTNCQTACDLRSAICDLTRRNARTRNPR